MSPDQLDDIILKYLKKEVTISEQHRLINWLNESDTNKQALNKIEIFWNNQNSEANNRKDKVWERLKSEVFVEEDSNAEKSSNFHFKVSYFVKVAAVLLIAFVFAFLLIRNDSSEITELNHEVKLIEKVTPYGQKFTITLPDGSKVKLNSGSRIIVPEKFTGQTRKIELISGEAFFEIEEDKEHPFIVQTGDLSVKVLGTAFDIKAYPEDENIHVAVDHGKVSVESIKNQERLVLLPDQMAIYNKTLKTSKKKEFNRKGVFSWTNKTLYFEKASIDEIFSELEKWYGVKINLNRPLEIKDDFSGEYQERSLKSVLDGLSYVYKFEFKIEENVVTIK